MKPSEEKCKDCPHFILWTSGAAGYPGCTHPEAGTRVITLLGQLPIS